jgi:hypothetical protein
MATQACAPIGDGIGTKSRFELLVPFQAVSRSQKTRKLPICSEFRVSDGTRTRDRLDHNQELYLLSYAHQACRPVRRDRAAFAI